MAKDMSAPGPLELVRQFANSLDPDHPERDPFLEVPKAQAWLEEHGLSAGVCSTEGEAEAARELRKAVLAQLLAHTGDEDEAKSWAALATELAGTRLELVFGDSGQASLCPEEEAGIGALRGAIASRVYDAVLSGEWRRLKACRKLSCLFAFYDRSKNGSGAWCDMAVCGNRVKAERRRARERTVSHSH
jgi:predicted RNA-binding Zn ribbon-like protein